MKTFALVLGALLSFSTPSASAPVSLTGAELLNFPGASFPTGIRSVVGDSLRIDATHSLSLIAALPLGQFEVDISDFEVQVDVTRLLRDDGVADQEVAIYFSDGVHLFGGVFVDGPGNLVRSALQLNALDSDGQSLQFVAALGQSASTTVPVNVSYLATIGVQSNVGNTIISGSVNNGVVAVTDTIAVPFNPVNNGPSLLFFSDAANDNYLFNSVTFTRGVSLRASVPEPQVFAGAAFGLAVLWLGVYRRRTKMT